MDATSDDDRDVEAAVQGSDNIETTNDGVSVQRLEVLPRTEEFERVCAQLRLPADLHCRSVTRLKPWFVDRTSFLKEKSKSQGPVLQLIYVPGLKGAGDLYDVLQFGFPSSDDETRVVDGVACDPGCVVLTDTLSHAVAAARAAAPKRGQPPSAEEIGAEGEAIDYSQSVVVLLCDIVVGARTLECTQEAAEKVVTREALEKADAHFARTSGHWITFKKTSVLPRYLVHVAPALAPISVDEQLRKCAADSAALGPEPAVADALTVHVEANGDLAGSISRAPSGATVVVHEGLFRQTFIIAGKSLRLLGRKGAVIQAPADAPGRPRPTSTVRVSNIAAGCRVVLEGLTIKANKRRDHIAGEQLSSRGNAEWEDANPPLTKKKGGLAASKGKGPKSHYPLIDQGRCANALEVTDAAQCCIVLNCTLYGGSEVSGGSVVYMKNTVISDGVVNGLYVTSSKVLVEDCVISRHDSANVAVERTSDAVFNRIRVYGSQSTGVYVFNGGRPVFDECEIYGNELTCIQLEGETTCPVVRKCFVHHGDQYGMFITGKARAEIESNHFYANTWAAICTTEGGNPRVVGNTIYRGGHYGVYMFDNGRGTVVDNYLHSNRDAGLTVASGAVPVVYGNEFLDGMAYGTYFFLKGEGRVFDNKICGHRQANVCITYGADPVLRRNRIYHSQAEGVSIMQEGKGLLEDNDIFSNYEGNVLLQFEATPVLRTNRIFSSKKTGVAFYHRAKGTVVDNEIFGSEFSGVAVKTGSDPLVEGNYIHDNKRFAVLVQMKGKGKIVKNRTRSNKMGSTKVWSDSHPVFVDNDFDAAEADDTKPKQEMELPKEDAPLPARPGEEQKQKPAGEAGDKEQQQVPDEKKKPSQIEKQVIAQQQQQEEERLRANAKTLIPGETYE